MRFYDLSITVKCDICDKKITSESQQIKSGKSMPNLNSYQPESFLRSAGMDICDQHTTDDIITHIRSKLPKLNMRKHE